MPQRLFIDIERTSLTDEDRDLLLHPEVAGIILFARNYESRSQLAGLVADIREARSELLIAVDQEGGRVQRFQDKGFTRLPALQRLGDLYARDQSLATEASFRHGWLMAAEILSVGLDLSFAPVLDLDDHRCKAIGDRSFSRDPAVTIALAKSYIQGMSHAGMSATAKHFPGHGSVDADSHHSLPEDPRSLKQIEEHDLKPFKALISSFRAVMPGHLLFPKIDTEPVGFSSTWLQSILRQSMGFEGVIFSDDLSMAGAAASGGYARRAELALAAGCDLLLACNNRSGTYEILDFLESGVTGSGAFAVDSMRAEAAQNHECLLSGPDYDRAQKMMKTLQEKIDA